MYANNYITPLSLSLCNLSLICSCIVSILLPFLPKYFIPLIYFFTLSVYLYLFLSLCCFNTKLQMSTKIKVQLRLMGLSLLLSAFGHKPKYWGKKYLRLLPYEKRRHHQRRSVHQLTDWHCNLQSHTADIAKNMNGMHDQAGQCQGEHFEGILF